MRTTKKMESREVRKRAEEVRNNWSATERRRRTGLPPDTPETIRSFIFGATTSEWKPVARILAM